MDAKNLIVDNSSNWETIEALDKLFPQLQRVSALALVIESVDPIDGSALVVASEQEKVLRVLDFVRQKKTDYLQVLLAPINIVS